MFKRPDGFKDTNSSSHIMPFLSTYLQRLLQWPPFRSMRKWLSPKHRRLLWRGITIISLILIAIGVLYTWRGLPDNSLEFTPIYLVAAVGFYALAYTMQLFGWHALSTLTFGHLPLRDNVEAVAASDLVKYLPTIAWYIANRVHFYNQRQIPRGSVVAASLLEMVVMLGSGTLIYFILWLTHVNSWIVSLGALIVLTIMLKLTVPRLGQWWRTKIAAHQTVVHNRGRYWITALLWYGITWPVGALFLAVILRAFTPIEIADYLPLFYMWLSSALIGAFVSISLGTLGVAREASLTFLLAQHWPLPVSIATAVSVKIILTLGQVVYALIILGWLRSTKRINNE